MLIRALSILPTQSFCLKMGIVQDKMDATNSKCGFLIAVQFAYTYSNMEFGDKVRY